MIRRLGRGHTTTTQLNRVGKQLFRDAWAGAHAVDVKPKLPSTATKYMILNLDRTGKPGSHWVAVIIKGATAYIFDSFARSSNKLIPTWLRNTRHRYKHIDAQHDKRTNQAKQSDICGQLSLAWMLYARARGISSAMKDI